MSAPKKWGECPDCEEPLTPLGLCMRCDEDDEGEDEAPVVSMAPPGPSEEELLQKYRKARIGLLLLDISIKELSARSGYAIASLRCMRAPSGHVTDEAARLLERVGGRDEGWLDLPTGTATLSAAEPSPEPAEPPADPLIDEDKRPNDDGEGAEPEIRLPETPGGTTVRQGLPKGHLTGRRVVDGCEFPIESNVQRPNPRPSKYPFLHMQPGDSFAVDVGDSTVDQVRYRVRQAWQTFRNNEGCVWKFSTTVEGEGDEQRVRVWRDS